MSLADLDADLTLLVGDLNLEEVDLGYHLITSNTRLIDSFIEANGYDDGDSGQIVVGPMLLLAEFQVLIDFNNFSRTVTRRRIAWSSLAEHLSRLRLPSMGRTIRHQCRQFYRRLLTASIFCPVRANSCDKRQRNSAPPAKDLITATRPHSVYNAIHSERESITFYIEAIDVSSGLL